MMILVGAITLVIILFPLSWMTTFIYFRNTPNDRKTHFWISLAITLIVTFLWSFIMILNDLFINDLSNNSVL